MSDRLPADQTDSIDTTSGPERRGPGRWLLTWAGVFTMVIVTAVIFIVAAFLVAD